MANFFPNVCFGNGIFQIHHPKALVSSVMEEFDEDHALILINATDLPAEK